MSAIGKRSLDLFVGVDVPLYNPDTETTTTYYWANRSWITNPNDSVAANRQYVGVLVQGLEYDFSWFNGDTVGGPTARNFGTLRAFNPDGTHSLDYIFEDGLSVQGQTLTFRLGAIGDDLSTMITRKVIGRNIRQSEDGTEVHIDLSDGSQALDSSIFIDRFQGLGNCVRHEAGDTSTVADSVSLDPSTAWYFDVAYRMRAGMTLGSGLEVASRAASGGGDVYRIDFASDGDINILSRTSADATVTLDATDLSWVADGRWHRVVGKWTGTVLEAYHSTRTGGTKSTVTAAQTTIKAGTGALSFGDVSTTLATHEYVDVALLALGVDADVPTEAEILDRMKRPLTDAEGDDCVCYLTLNENTGTTATDESGTGNDATVASDAWRPTFEGKAEQAGTAKPLSFGYVYNAPPTWADKDDGQAVVHGRGIKGLAAIYEGGNRLVIGWPKTRYQEVTFATAGDTISFTAREDPAGVDREEAQPGFAGLADGQKIVIAGTTSNNGTFTVNGSSTMNSVAVDENLTNEGPVDCYITALDEASGDPDVEVWFEAGALWFDRVPELHVSAEIYGDMGADTPTDSTSVHWPEYTAAIMRTILEDWGGETTVDTNWDTDPDNPIGAYWAHAGVWLDPARDRTIRSVLDEGDDSLWARWGQRPSDLTWDLHVINAPSGAADVDLTNLEILALRRIRSVPPVGGLTLRSTVNYAPLAEDEVAGAAAAADVEALRREHLEVRATVDSTVAASYPYAETPPAITTWLRERSDAQTEVQRRYDVLKTEREMYHAEVILYGLDQDPLNSILTITDADFPTTAAGKDFHLVRLDVNDEEVTLTGWG